MFRWLKSLIAPETVMLPLPLTVPEFEKWSDRIIAGANLPIGKGLNPYVTPIETQKFALAQMLMELQKVESFKSDVYFMHRLRNAAIAQVGMHMIEDLQAVKTERMKEAEAKALAERGANKPEKKGNVTSISH